MTTAKKHEILLVEDTSLLAKSYIQFLRNEPYTVTHVETGEEALEIISSNTPEAILLDLELPDMTGIDILKKIGGAGLPCPIIMITAHGSINIAVEAMRLGAFDFIIKPFNADRLIITLRNALDSQNLRNIVQTYRETVDLGGVGKMHGSSLVMQGVYRTIESAARSKATIFIKGESGTGKELCAEAIHQQSPRHDQPFIALNCAAIPRELMESEIFGHVKGAFSGAHANRDGAAAMANSGTLFMDEICEMDMDLQSKLLRFLQSETFQKVGSSKTEKVDIRFVCATNRDPWEEVQAGRFREDLYYRLHVIPIDLPPLRERDEDIILLAEEFLEAYSAQEGKTFSGFTASAKALLAAHNWPGNVRELQNAIMQVVVLNDGDEVTPEMLPDTVPKTAGAVPAGTESAQSAKNAPVPEPEEAKPSADTPDTEEIELDSEDAEKLSTVIKPLADVERETIERAIDLCDGKVRVAASLLGISHATLYRKINSWKDAD